jgi:hypothetical protein
MLAVGLGVRLFGAGHSIRSGIAFYTMLLQSASHIHQVVMPNFLVSWNQLEI